MELRKQIDINNLQKVMVVSGNRKGKVGIVLEYYESYGRALILSGNTRYWVNPNQLEVIEEEKELTVREVVEWLKDRKEYKEDEFTSINIHSDYSCDLLNSCDEHLGIAELNGIINLKQLTDLIRNKPTESELIEKFKELSMEEKIELLNRKE